MKNRGKIRRIESLNLHVTANISAILSVERGMTRGTTYNPAEGELGETVPSTTQIKDNISRVGKRMREGGVN